MTREEAGGEQACVGRQGGPRILHPPFLTPHPEGPGVEVGNWDRTRRDLGKVLLSREIPQGAETAKAARSAGSCPMAWSMSTGTVTTHLKGHTSRVVVSFQCSNSFLSSLSWPRWPTDTADAGSPLQGTTTVLALIGGPAPHTPEPLGPMCQGHRRLAREH